MTKTMKDSIGIDISKDHLDVHCCATGATARFTNDPAGFRALKRWIGDRQPHLLVYEATGPYHARFEQALAGKLPLVKVNPLQARRFAQARGNPGQDRQGRCTPVGADGLGARSGSRQAGDRGTQ